MACSSSGVSAVEEMAISKFKATCLAVLERVRRTRRPVRITRFGQPIAEVVPPSVPPRPERWLGCLAGTGRVTGDIVSPVAGDADWEALRE
jgi:prevent-host-death family protein